LEVGTAGFKKAGFIYFQMGKYTYNFGKKLLAKEAETDISGTKNNPQNPIKDFSYQMPLMEHGGYYKGLDFRPCAVFLSKRLLVCNG